MKKIAARRLPLIGAMTRDLERHGRLRPVTATVMWGAYAAHALLVVRVLRRPRARLSLPARPAMISGTALVAAGLATCLAGMRRFDGPSELTGTSNQALATTGIYRYSRNPQYVGYVTVLAGAALAQRSSTALACTGMMAAAYATWVPIEEHHLRELHGQTYDDYRHVTNRWWGPQQPAGPRNRVLLNGKGTMPYFRICRWIRRLTRSCLWAGAVSIQRESRQCFLHLDSCCRDAANFSTQVQCSFQHWITGDSRLVSAS
ncbi:MAG: phosphatidylethanolamine N-methyltransferase family protein [Nocardioides sp.]|nr:phosphatidylethanolamine N-methyltransferase family protein [Nocardioides sp.]